MTRPGVLLAGHIGKVHGISGEVYVVPISDDPRRFEPGAELLHSDGRRLTIDSARRHRNRFLVKFAGVDTRTDAEGLRGELYVGAERVRDLDRDEFWPHDLIGSTVERIGGETLGTVARVEPGPAHDQLVVATPRGEFMVPAVKAIVVGVDVGGRRITIDPPSGLLD